MEPYRSLENRPIKPGKMTLFALSSERIRLVQPRRRTHRDWCHALYYRADPGIIVDQLRESNNSEMLTKTPCVAVVAKPCDKSRPNRQGCRMARHPIHTSPV